MQVAKKLGQRNWPIHDSFPGREIGIDELTAARVKLNVGTVRKSMAIGEFQRRMGIRDTRRQRAPQ
ncbi:hypothetical protein [Nannocystis sp.]|uniref:hypothetical protein n=1 Tax=Nannocystis sp. TaxID=1962667 RepID=UPI0025EE0DB2|nr:hypothetical protein [Nannocystis sp.]MBK7830564.1 hypothetical protein [Nannocystis sp.]